MDFILLDIKNFLKKLENGQLEIEAGQWELHKDLANMKLAMGELKNLKENVEKMRINSIQQMNLIKCVQEKIEAFKQDRHDNAPVTISERSVKYEKVYKRPSDRQSSKGHKKRKNHLIRSEEILEITSQLSNEKSESEQEDLTSKAEECEERDFGPSSTQPPQRKLSNTIQSQRKQNSQYSRFTCNDILQRYLEDSAKYLEKKKSKTTDLTYMSSKQCNSEKKKSELDSHYTPFWDEYGLREQSNSASDKQNSAEKENASITAEEEEISILPKRLLCSSRARKFANKADFLRHKRNHKRPKIVLYCKICGKGFFGKGRLQEHKTVHQISSVDSTGFKCSYCNKVCSTPEKLTSHLRECRIIMRNYYRRK